MTPVICAVTHFLPSLESNDQNQHSVIQKTTKRTQEAQKNATVNATRARVLLAVSQLRPQASTIVPLLSYPALLMFIRRSIFGSPTVFTSVDNPPAFASSLVTRFLSYSFNFAYQAWLMVAPLSLSCDWSGRSIPLVESVTDVRFVKRSNVNSISSVENLCVFLIASLS